MRVLHVLHEFLPVSQNWIYPQVRHVKGVEAGVLCAYRTNPDLFPLQRIPAFHESGPCTAASVFHRVTNTILRRMGRPAFFLPAAAQAWRPDLIHAHFGMRGWGMLSIRSRLRIPLVTSFYGVDAWQFPTGATEWRKRYRRLFTEGACFLVEGPAMRDRLVGLGCPSEKVQILRLGIDLAAVQFAERDFTEPLRVLMMARFVEKKGFVDGLTACVKARHAGVELYVRIVGDAAKGDQAGEQIKTHLIELAGRPELANRLSFDGFLSPQAATAVMRECNIFLCPSKHAKDGDAEGGSPVVLTQAMAAGLLCIGTRHCDIPEVVIHERTGYLSDSGDTEAMASLLARAARAPVETKALTRDARQHIENHFSTDREVVELERIYTRLAANRR